MKPRWLAIVNPLSGGNRRQGQLRQTLDDLRPVAERTVVTSHAGHAAELASNAQAYTGVVAVGGDGTLFEILRGLDRSQQRVALVPAGRGNSLARDLGLLRSGSLAHLALWEQPRTIDLLEVRMTAEDSTLTTCWSASTVALGYPGAVTVRAKQLARLGRFSYAAATAMVRPVAFSAQVAYDGQPAVRLRLTGLVANNTRHVANFLAFRNASCCDGRFEMMEMRSGLLGQTAHNLSALCRTRLYEPCRLLQAQAVQVALDQPRTLMIDGELFAGIVAVEVRILPGALSFQTPGIL